MPEVILPCPACGSTDCECLVCTINADESQTIHFHMACNKCFTSGPIADDAESAKKLWDSIPRALTWTHEPPNVAGLYMLRAVLTALGDGQYGPIQLLNITQDMLVYSHRKDFQWAGPIAQPIEP